MIGLLLVKDYCLFRTHRGGQKGAIILADLFGHQVVEQGVHPQDRVFVFVTLQSEVVQLVGILAEVEQLDVVVLEDLIERLRSVERGGGVVTREVVASIEHKGQESALAEVGVHLGERWQRLAATATPPRLLHWPHEKTDWEKNHARDRSCFAQYRNNGFAAHRRGRQAPVGRSREPGGGGQQKLVLDLSREGHQRQLHLRHTTTVSGHGVGARWLLPTESVSRDGVWDGIYLVVTSAALEPRAGTRRRARLPWQHSPRAGDGNSPLESRHAASGARPCVISGGRLPGRGGLCFNAPAGS